MNAKVTKVIFTDTSNKESWNENPKVVASLIYVIPEILFN